MHDQSIQGTGLISTDVEVPNHLKKCLYCSIPLRRVSLGVRHPDACNARKRKGQPITAEVTERKRILSGLAFEKLRLAQREKRRRMRQTIEQARKIENGEGGRGIASGTGWSPTQTLGWKPILAGVDADLSVVPAATVITAYGIDTERCYGNQGEDPQRALGYAPQSPNHRCSHSATAVGTNTAGETDCNMLNNTAHPTQLAATFASNPTDEAAVYALPTQYANTMEGLSAYEADSLLNSSSDFLRAATLSSNTADGAAAVYLPTQHGSMTEGIPDYDAVSFLNSHSDVLRAATLGSNTADGTAVYSLPTQHGSMTERTSGYSGASFPISGVQFLRAATLCSNTADGATTYPSLGQQSFEVVSLSQDELFLDNSALPN
ncbi:hypothetical protein CDV36_015745 [Fusarium kuroshium]|uniref:Uncharacterized protein n=2 Tax=Fusarium solani species complex TaxID=232080 RepID=A0A3M2R8A3_9HYPO|nr:hypothetical protein CDV36_015745 [Fusarium kuroshium]RSL52177.1 hypothetical protein CEP51_015099 [Fusarium floridanum]